MPDRYWTRGGARVSGWYFSWPFALTEVAADSIALRILWRRWEIPRSSLRSIRRVRGLTAKGFALEHTEAGVPADLVVYPAESAAFERALAQLELSVDGTHAWSGRAHL